MSVSEYSCAGTLLIIVDILDAANWINFSSLSLVILCKLCIPIVGL